MLSKLTVQAVADLVATGTRMDERGLMEFRPVKVETNVVNTAEGSALVNLGATKVLVGVKLSVGIPYPDSPEEGVLITTAELAPMASPKFEPGPPDQNAVELARVVDRVVRESKMIPFEKLFIEEEKVWMVNLDFYSLDMDGNLFDAATLGAVAALRTAKFPKLEDGKLIYEEKKEPLPVVDKPVSVTFAKIQDKLLVDPTDMEEKIMSCRLTLGVNQEDNLCALQKGGLDGFTEAEIGTMVDEAIKQAKKLRKVIA